MTKRLISFGLPAYLFLCLLAGGSAQGVWSNFVLQILAVTILASLALESPVHQANSHLRTLRWLLAAFFALVFVQLVPLPPSIWAKLPGRALVVQGFDLLQSPLPWRPWSFIPANSMVSLFPVLVPVAVLFATARGGGDRPIGLVAALVTATLLGVFLGFLQITSTNGDWYLYRDTSLAAPVGFFANSNHMGILLLANIPFVTAVAADQFSKRKNVSQRGLVLGAAVGICVILMVSSILNKSLAVISLGGPVILLSLCIPEWKRGRIRTALFAMAAFVLAASIVAAATSEKFLWDSQRDSFDTRSEIWATSSDAIADLKYTGSGLGTFQEVYRLHENPDTVDLTYVNHAHNDYLEVGVELGLVGLLIIALFLVWWGLRVAIVWNRQGGDVYVRAASVASAAILLHSLVDFPLRTAAVSAVFAMCVGILATRITILRPDGHQDLWEPRHSAFGCR